MKSCFLHSYNRKYKCKQGAKMKLNLQIKLFMYVLNLHLCEQKFNMSKKIQKNLYVE